MKKLLCTLLCTLLCAGLLCGALAGCGNQGEPPASASTAPSSQADAAGGEDQTKAEKKEEEPVYTYKIYQELSVAPEADGEMIKYWEDQFGCKFEFEFIEKDKRSEIVPLRLASGERPDVICTMGYDNFRSWVDEGICGGWDPQLLRDRAPKIAAAMDTLGESAWTMACMDGKQFTIPGVNGNYAYGSAMVWRDSWLKKAGLEIPRTYEDFEKAIYSFANDDPDGNGAKDTFGLSNTGITWVFGNFGVPQKTWIDDGSGGVAYSALNPQTKACLETLAKWYADGVIDPEYVTGENKGGYWAVSHAFDNGRIGFTAMGVSAHWSNKDLMNKGVEATANQELFYENFPDEEYSFGYPIEMPGGKKYTGNTSFAYWSAFGAELCQDEGRLGKFFEIIQKTNGFEDPTDVITARYGKQGEQWEYDGDNKPTLLEGWDSDSTTRIGAGSCFIFANNILTDAVLDPLSANWRDNVLYGDKDRSAVWDTLVPTALSESADYVVEIEKIFDECSNEIITGKQPIGYYDTMCERIRAAGYDQCLAEANAIHQEYFGQ